MTIDEIISSVRFRLNEPDEKSLAAGRVLRAVAESVQNFVNQLAATPHPFSIQHAPLTVDATSRDYKLSQISNFGGLVRVVTEDLSDPGHNEAEVNICEIQNIDQYYAGPVKATSGGHSAICVSPFWGPDLMLRVTPQPAETVTYRIWYKVGLYQPGGMANGDSPPVPEHHHLIVVSAAQTLLPNCTWNRFGGERQESMREMILRDLEKKEAQYQFAFDRYRSNNQVEGVADRLFYGDD